MLDKISEFFQDIFNWIRNVIERKQELRILESYSSTYCQFDLIECVEPGVVDWNSFKNPSTTPKYGVWRIDHKYSKKYLFYVLINVAKLKEDLASFSLRKSDVHWKSVFTSTAKLQLQNQENIAATHMVLLFSVEKENNTTGVRIVNSKVQKYEKIECKQVILCDLQGFTQAWLGINNVAKQVSICIVKRLASKMWHPGVSISWDEIVDSIDYVQWLTVFARQFLGENHILQPPISRLHLPRTLN